jgi:hypothetical protein
LFIATARARAFRSIKARFISLDSSFSLILYFFQLRSFFKTRRAGLQREGGRAMDFKLNEEQRGLKQEFEDFFREEMKEDYSLMSKV